MEPLFERTCLFFWKIYHSKLIRQCGSKMTTALHITPTQRDKHIIVSDVLGLFGGIAFIRLDPAFA
jgi:hypothetical protein